MRDPATGQPQPTEARLASAADSEDSATATPLARDERFTLADRQEHTEEPATSDIADWVTEYKENPLIRKSTRLYVSDVVEPGYDIDVRPADPQADTESYDEPTVPEQYPNPTYHGLDLSDALVRWLSRSVITGDSFDRDFRVILEHALTDAIGRRGAGLVEHVYDDPTERSRLLGLRAFKVEEVTAYTREGKAILLRPDDSTAELRNGTGGDGYEAARAPTLQIAGDDDRDDLPRTLADKTAAFVQYDDIYGNRERSEIPFALDDVTMLSNDPDTGELFGRPESASVVPRAKALRTQLEDVDQGLKNAAWNNIVANVNTDDKEEAKQMLAGLDPNSPDSLSVTNTAPEITELNGEVPDVVSLIKQEVEYVLSGLPVPLYRVGFEGEINRDVTGEQSDDYQDQLARERRRLEATFRTVLDLKACEFMTGHAHPDDADDNDLYGTLDDVPDVALQVRPDDETNPLRSEHFDANEFLKLMQGLKQGAPGGQVSQVLTPRAMLELVPGLDPDEVLPDATQEAEAMSLGPLDDADPAVREAFDDVMGVEEPDEAMLATRYSEGDEVDTPDGEGVLVETRTESFTGPSGDDVDASDDSPAYVVGVESGAAVFRASDLSLLEDGIQVDGVDDPEATLEAAAAAVDIAEATNGDVPEAAALADDGRQFDYPDSWQESETPNRIILLKAWAGLGGQFSTCRARLGSARLCASMKDRVLRWEGWRK